MRGSVAGCLMTREWRNMAATLGLAYPSESVEAKRIRCFHGLVGVHRQEWASPGLVLGLDLYDCLRGNATSWGTIGRRLLGSQGLRQRRDEGLEEHPINALSGLENRGQLTTLSVTERVSCPFCYPLPSTLRKHGKKKDTDMCFLTYINFLKRQFSW